MPAVTGGEGEDKERTGRACSVPEEGREEVFD